MYLVPGAGRRLSSYRLLTIVLFVQTYSAVVSPHVGAMSIVCRAFGALLLFIGSASAQSGGSRAVLTGHWLVRYEHERRTHLSDTQIVIDTARLTLHQRGDSVTGEWQSIA